MRLINKPKLRFKAFKDDWKNEKLSDIGKIVTGNTPKTSDLDNYDNINGLSWITPTDISKGTAYNTRIKLSKKGAEKSRIVPANSILMTCIGNSIGGKVLSISETGFNQQINALVPINHDPYFLFSRFSLMDNIISSFSSTGTMPIINKTEFSNIKFYIPNSENEQRQIGLFFNKIDKLIELKGNKIASLERLKRGYLQKLFTDLTENKPKLRFKGFNDDWKEVELKEIGNIVTGNTPPKNNKDNYYNGSYTWVTPTDINTDENYIYDSDTKLSKTGYDKSRKVPENSILVTCIASIGKNAITGKTVSFNQQINALVPNDNYYPYFIYTLSSFWSLAMKKITSNVSLKLVNKNDFSQLKTKVPNYKEQSKIGTAMKLIDKQINLQRKELNRLKSLKKGYLQKMFI